MIAQDRKSIAVAIEDKVILILDSVFTVLRIKKYKKI